MTMPTSVRGDDTRFNEEDQKKGEVMVILLVRVCGASITFFVLIARLGDDVLSDSGFCLFEVILELKDIEFVLQLTL